MSLCICPKCGETMNSVPGGELVLQYLSKFRGFPEGKWDIKFLKFSEDSIKEACNLSHAGGNRTIRQLRGAGLIYPVMKIRKGNNSKLTSIYALTDAGKTLVRNLQDT